jgi:hypothetical protein
MPEGRWVKWWGINPDHPLLTEHHDGVGVWLWLYLLHQANWKNGSQLERGQLYCSVRTLSEDLNIPATTVHRILKTMERESMIVKRSVGRKPTVLTICNYERYQGDTDDGGTVSGTQTERRRNTSVRRKEGKKNYNGDFEVWWEGFPRKADKAAAARAWAARMREGVSVESLTMARDAYATLRRGLDPRYTMHGSTFLNGRWAEFIKYPGQVISIRKCRDCGNQFAEEELMELDTGWLCHGCGAGYSDYHELVRRDADKRRLQAERGQGRESVDLFGVTYRGGDEEGP